MSLEKKIPAIIVIILLWLGIIVFALFLAWLFDGTAFWLRFCLTFIPIFLSVKMTHELWEKK